MDDALRAGIQVGVLSFVFCSAVAGFNFSPWTLLVTLPLLLGYFVYLLEQ